MDKCRRCGEPIGPDDEDGLCPVCEPYVLPEKPGRKPKPPPEPEGSWSPQPLLSMSEGPAPTLWQKVKAVMTHKIGRK